MATNYLTLSRQSLYEMVWGTPISQLAAQFGITDVGLAKRCRNVDVPIPYRGYWARVAAGQTPAKTPLPKYRNSIPTNETVTAGAAATARSRPKEPEIKPGTEPIVRFGVRPGHVDAAPQPAATLSEIEQRIARLSLPDTGTLATACATVRRTAKHYKLPGRARIPLAADERDGWLIDLDVTEDTLSRALLLADQFIRACEALGWPLTGPRPPQPPLPNGYGYSYRQEPTPQPTPPTPPNARLLVEGEAIAFRIEERRRDEPRTPTKAELAREKRDYFYHAPRTTQVPTGALRLVRLEECHYWAPTRRTWYDHSSKTVEKQIPKILAGFYELAQDIKVKRAADEERERQYEERRRREEDEKELRAAHAALIAELERQSQAWHHARRLRHYLRAARRKLGSHVLPAKFRDQTIDFLQWATEYVDQLDPLSATPRNPAQGPKDISAGVEAGDRLKAFISRLHDPSARSNAGAGPAGVLLETSADDQDSDDSID